MKIGYCDRIGTPEKLAKSKCRRGKADFPLISQAKGQSSLYKYKGFSYVNAYLPPAFLHK